MPRPSLGKVERRTDMRARLTVGVHRGRFIAELPDDVVLRLQLRPGDEVDVDMYSAVRPPIHRRSLAALRKYRGRLPAGFKFDREDANRR